MDILDAPDVKPVHAASIELMREVPFDLLTPLPLYPLASLSPDAPPVPIHRFLFGLLAFPLTPSPIRFRNVRPHSQFAQSNRNLVAVIPLVRHYFLDSTGMHLIFAFRWFGRNNSATAAPASITVASTVAVSAAAPPCVVTATIAPVSISTAFSALYASAVRPSFSFVISASPSLGLSQSSLEVFFLRLRSMRRNAAASLAFIPSASANRSRYSL